MVTLVAFTFFTVPVITPPIFNLLNKALLIFLVGSYYYFSEVFFSDYSTSIFSYYYFLGYQGTNSAIGRQLLLLQALISPQFLPKVERLINLIYTVFYYSLFSSLSPSSSSSSSSSSLFYSLMIFYSARMKQSSGAYKIEQFSFFNKTLQVKFSVLLSFLFNKVFLTNSKL